MHDTTFPEMFEAVECMQLPAVEVLHEHLRGAVFYGVTAPALIQHYPEIVDLLYPTDGTGALELDRRAIRAEGLIRSAAEAVDRRIGGEAASAVLGLALGTQGRKLKDRRRIAAAVFDVQPDTFRRPNHEGRLMLALATEIVRIRLDAVATSSGSDELTA